MSFTHIPHDDCQTVPYLVLKSNTERNNIIPNFNLLMLIVYSKLNILLRIQSHPTSVLILSSVALTFSLITSLQVSSPDLITISFPISMALWRTSSQKLEIKMTGSEREITPSKEWDFETPGGIEVAFNHRVSVLSHPQRYQCYQ